MISTSTLVLIVAMLTVAGCDSSSHAPDLDTPLVPAPRASAPAETASQKSYRLLPKIVPAGPRSSLVAPLVAVDEELGFGIELVLRKPGESRPPTLGELAEIQALGRPIPELLARNLRRYLTDPPPELDVMQGIGTSGSEPRAEKAAMPRIYRLIVDFPGRESLILLPELWQRFAQQDQRRVCMALPMRTRLMILPRDDPKLLEELAPTLARIYREAGEPICGHYVFFEDGKLVAGPSFASLAGDKR